MCIRDSCGPDPDLCRLHRGRPYDQKVWRDQDPENRLCAGPVSYTHLDVYKRQPIYDLTSIIYRYGIEDASKIVEERKQTYINRLLYWKEHLDTYKGEWAEFMRK